MLLELIAIVNTPVCGRCGKARQGKASYTAVSRQRRAEPRYRAQIVAEHTSRQNNNTLHINTKLHKYITICGKAGRSRKT